MNLLFPRTGEFAFSLKFGSQLGQLSFELDHPANTLDVETSVGQLSDPSQSSQIVIAVATRTATGAVRLEQSTPFIDTQGLWMHTGQFSGY
jgi:hypothetical protein